LDGEYSVESVCIGNWELFWNENFEVWDKVMHFLYGLCRCHKRGVVKQGLKVIKQRGLPTRVWVQGRQGTDRYASKTTSPEEVNMALMVCEASQDDIGPCQAGCKETTGVH
jgi:hypothetical protein